MRAFFTVKVKIENRPFTFNVSASPNKDFTQYYFKIEDASKADQYFANGVAMIYFTVTDHFKWSADQESDKILTIISNEIRRQKMKWRQHV